MSDAAQVMIAQERMANNTVFVFEKDGVFITEIRSVVENSSRNPR
jgi:hypothetical protein